MGYLVLIMISALFFIHYGCGLLPLIIQNSDWGADVVDGLMPVSGEA
jgi:hypothetical protein